MFINYNLHFVNCAGMWWEASNVVIFLLDIWNVRLQHSVCFASKCFGIMHMESSMTMSENLLTICAWCNHAWHGQWIALALAWPGTLIWRWPYMHCFVWKYAIYRGIVISDHTAIGHWQSKCCVLVSIFSDVRYYIIMKIKRSINLVLFA